MAQRWRVHGDAVALEVTDSRQIGAEVTARSVFLSPRRRLVNPHGAFQVFRQLYLQMLTAYEDKRFEQHIGVDGSALLRAAYQFARAGHIVSGGSTLTMQVARLLEPRFFLHHGFAAKLFQIVRAVQLEERYSKDQILSDYLTLAPMGGNLEGVRAASFAYFGKPPAALDMAESALLVALPQSPARQRPDRHAVAARHGRDKVLARMVDGGDHGQRRRRQSRDARRGALPAQGDAAERATSG